MRIIRNKSVRFAALLCGAAMALPMWAAPALAQGADEANGNDIIVTAQRRSEKLEQVPMSVQVVSQDTMSSLGVNSVRDLANVTSGFQVNNSGTFTQPAVRGVTTTNSGSYENNVALWVDGLYEITPQILNLDLPNVQSLQILKGPQGALYGRNATGGTILIETTNPGDTWKGQLEATYGRFNDLRFRGYAAGPLSDKIGFSIAGTYRKTDGYYKRVSLTDSTKTDGRGLGLEQESIRMKLVAALTDSFKATIGYNYTRASDPRGTFFTPTENLTAGYPARQVGEFAGDVFDLDFKQHEASLKLELETGIGTLRSVTGFQHATVDTTYDSDGIYSSAAGPASAATQTYADSQLIDNTWQENLDFTINAIDRVDLIIGATYFHNSEKYAPGRENVTNLFPFADPTKLAGTPLSAYNKLSAVNSTRTKEALAGFIDATWHATDRLSINVGGRYSSETQDIAASKTCYMVNNSLGCLSAVIGANALPYVGIFPNGTYANGVTVAGGIASASSKYSKFTPRASIRYEISPRTNIYFSYSQGFKAGEWNGVIPGDDPATWRKNGQIGQETIDAFEIGIKGANSRLRFDLAGFYYNYHNIQTSSVQFVNGVTSVLLQSLPKARIYGVEGNVDFDVTPNFKARAGFTWLDAKYGAGAFYRGIGVNGAGTVAVANSSDPLKNLPNTSVVVPLWQDLSGLQMVRAPDFSGYIGFEYNIPMGEGGLKFAANVKYTSSYVVTDPSLWGGESPSAFTTRTGLAAPTVATPSLNSVQLAGTSYSARSNEQRARQSGYALLNASVTWTDPSDHYFVRVWGNNLTNKTYFTHYRPSSRTYTPIGEPVTFGGTIGFKF